MQINQALERLAGLVEGMRQVSVDIAHDLKTPLNRLSFTVQNAIDSEEAGQPVTLLLQQAQEETQQINTTFEALLRIAQIESGARRARFKDVALGPILEALFEAYEGVAEENRQFLSLQLQPLPDIIGDKDLLTQLFANLIENAIRHCPTGTAMVLSASRAAATRGQRLRQRTRHSSRRARKGVSAPLSARQEPKHARPWAGLEPRESHRRAAWRDD